MWKRFRALFGSNADLLGSIEALRGRVEQLESGAVPNPRVEMALEKIARTNENLGGLTARVVQIETEVDAIHDDRKDLIIAIAEGIERTDRAERRIKNTIRRARKELESRGYADPGLEAEAFEFSQVDGDGVAASGLQPVPVPLATASEESSIPGVSLETLRIARGG